MAFYDFCKISFIRNYRAVDAAQLLVHTLVTSKLDYCNSLLYGLPKYLIKQLQCVQNAAAPVVTVSPKFCHITTVLKNLHWLLTDLRIEFKVLTITYKALHGLAPTSIKDRLNNYHPPGDLRSSKKNLLVVPAFNRNSYGRRAFAVQLLRRFFGTVFLSILGMLDHLTFLKDGFKLLFLYGLFSGIANYHFSSCSKQELLKG